MKNTQANNSVSSTNEQNNSPLITAQNNEGAALSTTNNNDNKHNYLGTQGSTIMNIQNKKEEINNVEEEIKELKNYISELKAKLKNKKMVLRYQKSDITILNSTGRQAIKLEINYLNNKKLSLEEKLFELKEEFDKMNDTINSKLISDKIILRTKNIHWCIRNKWQIKTRVLSLLENLKLEKSEEIFELKSNLTSVDSFNKSLRDLLNKHKPTLSKYCTNELYPLIFPEIYEIIKQWDGNFDSPLVENEKKNILPLEKAV